MKPLQGEDAVGANAEADAGRLTAPVTRVSALLWDRVERHPTSSRRRETEPESDAFGDELVVVVEGLAGRHDGAVTVIDTNVESGAREIRARRAQRRNERDAAVPRVLVCARRSDVAARPRVFSPAGLDTDAAVLTENEGFAHPSGPLSARTDRRRGLRRYLEIFASARDGLAASARHAAHSGLAAACVAPEQKP